ncbi:cupin [Kiloniella spongiae]|uniref:Cupin n=1 Tax=Kiloniella spongiae TaxID=1489064 RepID=A0A0H2MZV8_9PROT|nr:cupin [Kiloniella spongiae]KLN62200.1 cupin [Kiloniella spongiae]
MKFIETAKFIGNAAWDAMDIAQIEGATVRLHWTDEPYKWHKNDGDEVFVVLNGKVRMLYKKFGQELEQLIDAGNIFYAGEGDEHVAHPVGIARVLVIEKAGSI